ncbi:MAG: hypothetical protein KME25_10405 [Symplocastrum torsivum CPER-KK1]|uniref:Uncharacterized protein n=1 Tax=Symplocastrum torsivum CPER-KK1 TaxID=450513 RepID=A0A951PLE3_9CYAN|nr:hypothetical protein [Symplocastrum torsivum CPER-KK1]
MLLNPTIAGSTDAGGDMPLNRCEKYSAISLKAIADFGLSKRSVSNLV